MRLTRVFELYVPPMERINAFPTVGAAIGRPLQQCDIVQTDERCSPLRHRSNGFDEVLQLLGDNRVAGIVKVQTVHGVGIENCRIVGVKTQIVI